MIHRNKKKRITNIFIVAVLVALAVGGMLAYLTDRDSEVNVFTVGNVYVDLIENFDQGAELLPGREVTKEAFIKNIGKSDAWVWMTIAIPAELDTAEKTILHWGSPAVNSGAAELQQPSVTTEIDDVTYNVYTLLYKDALKFGDTTALGLSKVYLDNQVDYSNGQYYWVDGGSAAPITFDIASTEVHVSAYAIQKEGFDNVKVAYEAFQKQWKTNGTEFGN